MSRCLPLPTGRDIPAGELSSGLDRSTVRCYSVIMTKTVAPKHSVTEIDSILVCAHAAGVAAAAKCTPAAMVVSQHANPFDPTSPVVASYAPISAGVCGFAWVNIKPGTSRLAKRMLAVGSARRDSYCGGVTRWVSEFGQSMERKEAFAHEFAKVLTDHGYTAYAGSRMD